VGVAGHPSDKGMRMIEQRIWDSIKDYFNKINQILKRMQLFVILLKANVIKTNQL